VPKNTGEILTIQLNSNLPLLECLAKHVKFYVTR